MEKTLAPLRIIGDRAPPSFDPKFNPSRLTRPQLPPNSTFRKGIPPKVRLKLAQALTKAHLIYQDSIDPYYWKVRARVEVGLSILLNMRRRINKIVEIAVDEEIPEPESYAILIANCWVVTKYLLHQFDTAGTAEEPYKTKSNAHAGYKFFYERGLEDYTKAFSDPDKDARMVLLAEEMLDHLKRVNKAYNTCLNTWETAMEVYKREFRTRYKNLVKLNVHMEMYKALAES